MISSASLSAFSASAIGAARTGSLQRVAATQQNQSRAQSAAGAAPPAKPGGPIAPGQILPRGSLLNLSV